jgi:hypothetical protein
MKIGMKPKTDPKGNMINSLLSSLTLRSNVKAAADARMPSQEAMPETITSPIIVNTPGISLMLHDRK